MGKLSSFTFISLDGYYKDENNDISWHQHGVEETQFSADNLQHGDILLFGRTTYDMMVGFWPTDMARDAFPEVAEGMNSAEKIVFSRTMQSANWNNTRIIKDMITEVRALKQETSKNMTLLGSGSIMKQLADEDLIDTFSFMIDPVALGKGYSVFGGLIQPLNLVLKDSKVFGSGVVLLNYERKV